MKIDNPHYFSKLMEKMMREIDLIRIGERTERKNKMLLLNRWYTKELIKEFPKNHKKLVSILSDGKPKDTKDLKDKLVTKSLKGLVMRTRKTIKKFGFHHILVIKKTKGEGSFPKYYYTLVTSFNEHTSDVHN